MTLRKLKRKLDLERKVTAKRYERHRRANLLAQPGPHKFITVLDHLRPFFNIGKIFRSADAFGCQEVHLVGIDFFDPAPAMGSFKCVPAKYHETFDQSYQELRSRNYTLYALDPTSGENIAQSELPAKSAFIFGHEEFGLNFDPNDYPDIKMLKIPQLGKVQSLNVSIAASIIMYEYLKQHDPSFKQETPN
jgi:tRNA G18 (ribose-2'-O)-methylase SpoU